MKRLIARRPTPAMVVAVIALIAALSGSAYAGHFLTTKKFRKQAIRGPLTYVTDTPSIQPTGPLGVGGGPGVHVKANCPNGTHVIGGGLKLSNEQNMLANDDYPTVDGWAGTVYNSAGQPQTATITAICATSVQTNGKVPGQ